MPYPSVERHSQREFHGVSVTGRTLYMPLTEQVRELAYRKWEEAGCPDGRDKEFWMAAEQELKEKAW
jgi:hypothetical protein